MCSCTHVAVCVFVRHREKARGSAEEWEHRRGMGEDISFQNAVYSGK